MFWMDGKEKAGAVSVAGQWLGYVVKVNRVGEVVLLF